MQFIALYRAPVSVIDEWMKTPEEERKEQEKKMSDDWKKWMDKSGLTGNTMATGLTKKVSSDGISDTRNDIMLYTIVEADSAEDAAALFENHPHLQIPQATIEVMPIRPM